MQKHTILIRVRFTCASTLLTRTLAPLVTPAFRTVAAVLLLHHLVAAQAVRVRVAINILTSQDNAQHKHNQTTGELPLTALECAKHNVHAVVHVVAGLVLVAVNVNCCRGLARPLAVAKQRPNQLVVLVQATGLSSVLRFQSCAQAQRHPHLGERAAESC